MPDLMHLSPGEIATGVVLFGGAITVIAGWWKVIRPRWRKVASTVVAIRDAILGRDEIHDSITGAKIADALPGMGVRTAHLEQQMTHQVEQMGHQVAQMRELTQVVKTLAETQSRQQDHGARLDAHDAQFAVVNERLTKVELGAAERVVARVESTAAFRAIEEAIKAQPDHEGDVVDEDPAED